MATITTNNDTRISCTDLWSGQLKTARLLCAVAVPAFGAFAGVRTAGPVRSVGAITFVDVDTVVIADSRAGLHHGLGHRGASVPRPALVSVDAADRVPVVDCVNPHDDNLQAAKYRVDSG